MKDKTIRYILVGIVYILALISLVWGAIEIEKNDNTEHKVKCYDRYNNEIEGLTCIDKKVMPNEGSIMLILGISLISINILLLNPILKMVEEIVE